MRGTGDRSYLGVIEGTFRAAQRSAADAGFIDRFFDDNGWWALAWVAAYDLTKDRRYLAAARRSSRTTRAAGTAPAAAGCGGTPTGGTRTRSPTSCSSRSRRGSPSGCPGQPGVPGLGAADLGMAARQRHDRAGGLVNDGLTAGCQNNGGTTWTYNQGVVLGGLAALCELTGDPGYLRAGEDIADAALQRPGRPAGHPRRAVRAVRLRRRPDQFKGIFVRYLDDFSRLRQAGVPGVPPGQRRLRPGTGARTRRPVGLCWAGPFDKADASRQSSAVEVPRRRRPDGLRDRSGAAGGSRTRSEPSCF